MCKCPKCGRYMSSYLENIFGDTRVIWSCICGYSNKQDSYTVPDNRTYVVENPKVITIHHEADNYIEEEVIDVRRK